MIAKIIYNVDNDDELVERKSGTEQEAVTQA